MWWTQRLKKKKKVNHRTEEITDSMRKKSLGSLSEGTSDWILLEVATSILRISLVVGRRD